MEFNHYSVMLHETIEELHIQPDGIYVDGTLGGGGHAYEVCSRLSDRGHFYGIDQDAAAIQAAGERLSPENGPAADRRRCARSSVPSRNSLPNPFSHTMRQKNRIVKYFLFEKCEKPFDKTEE